MTPAKPVKLIARDRLVVVANIYHQRAGGQPSGPFTPPFSRLLETQEQPYDRELVASAEWRPLDAGWVSRPGMLVIRNDEGRFTQVQPTEAERAEALVRVVEIGVEVGGLVIPCWRVRPGEFSQVEPIDVPLLRVRCASGSARFSLYLVPG